MRSLLAVLCLLLVHLVYVEAGHKCGHVPPQRVGYAATTSSRTRRQATERQPIRIVPVFYKDDFNQLSQELREKYKTVVNKSIKYLSSFLTVEPLTQNIVLQRFCDTSSQLIPVELSALNPYDHCTPNAPCQATYCAFPPFLIPEEHLKACKTCDTVNSANCSTDGQDGPGVPDADFVVYMAARDFFCDGALAFASHCYQDLTTDRPIAGVVNLCPSLSMKLEMGQDIDSLVLTIAHELTHALVFSPHLRPFYRDENGNPRTPRDKTTGLPPLLHGGNMFLGFFEPSTDTVLQETVKREALNGVYEFNVTKVVTPAVLRESRNHFGCPTLNGMELENLRGDGTRYYHWKKRLVENEAMTGVISTNGVFSRLTFALYEDSGWYDVDYSVASPLRFGQCLGCDFAEKSCYSYGLGREPFCREEEILPFINLGGRTGGANSSCTYDRLAVASCNVMDFNLAPNLTVPIQYQYFSKPNLGGSEQTVDYCPIRSGLAHCQRKRDLGDNVFLESLGPSSKCVDFEVKTNWAFNSTNIPPIYGGACYEVSCASEGSVSITVDQTTVLCQSAGQEMTVQAGGFNIVIICPAFEDICWENSTTCPTTTSAPPSGLSQGGAVAIGIVFGLILPAVVAIAVAVVVLLVICKRRGGGKSQKSARAEVNLEAYHPPGKELT